MKKLIIVITLISIFTFCKEREKPANLEDVGVYFIEPVDGAELKNPIKIKMGVKGMVVSPAGELKDGTGHHHIIIDGVDYIEEGVVIPTDKNHIHFGDGSTETELTLPPGEHSLTLQFADGLHRSYGPKFAKKIKILVKE